MTSIMTEATMTPTPVTLTVTEVTLVQQSGLDQVGLTTTLPCPYVDATNGPLYLTFHVRKGGGLDYLREHFGLSEGQVRRIVVP
jgi:hypothetical protein